MMSVPLTALLLALALPTVSAAEETTIRATDDLFLMAVVIGCGTQSRVIEHASPEPDGSAELLGYVLPVVGLKPSELAANIAAKVEKETGHRPTSFEVRAHAAEEHKATVDMLLALAQYKSQGCNRILNEEIDRDNQELERLDQLKRLATRTTYNMSLDTDLGTLRSRRPNTPLSPYRVQP